MARGSRPGKSGIPESGNWIVLHVHVCVCVLRVCVCVGACLRVCLFVCKATLIHGNIDMLYRLIAV